MTSVRKPRIGSRTTQYSLACVIALAAIALHAAPPPAEIDLSDAVVVAPDTPATRVLVEEVEKRTTVRLPTQPAAAAPPAGSHPLIVLDTASAGAPGPEGYTIRVDASQTPAPIVTVRGADARGTLFAVGRLLRELHLSRGALSIPRDLRISTAPKVALRGHQLGYRPKTNSYDGWTVAMWDQYIRDLAMFGTNAIELIPPRSDDAPDSPHFPLPQMPMMIEMDKIIDRYGLDVWVWYPALDPDYTTPAAVDHAVREWADIFEKLPRIDAVFVPGGDPGHTKPAVLMALLEKQAASLRRFHPHAQFWVSPQGFNKPWMDEFYDLLRADARWLTGIVFGPQIRDSLEDLRQRVPARYPIRHYPDITHSLRAQYPVPDWDLAHALTSGREPINPGPQDEAAIFRRSLTSTVGFITYSEGNNDDVNKIVWSGLGWDPDAKVEDIVRQYSRYFIGDPLADRYAQGLLALEQNWRGPLLTNTAVDETLAHFQAMERDATPQQLLNWRFQQGLYRAYYDAYVRARLIDETKQEARAMAALRTARKDGALAAMTEAEHALAPQPQPLDSPADSWRLRVYALAEALFQSARVQSSVARYRAIGIERGATLDTVERPLNNRLWLAAQFQRIRALPDEAARLAAIDRLTSWTDPGPGGFYDDLGDPAHQPHLVPGAGSVGFGYKPDWRLSWMTHAESLYDAPLKMRYSGLDPRARYRLRIIYAGDVYNERIRIRLMANDTVEVAPPIVKPPPTEPVEYDLSPGLTRTGALTLTWTQDPGQGGSGRGCQVAEVWLTRQP